ncbi:MAG: gamma-glutamyltransferase family protein [Pseudomonadota bacterium]|nr:gamma-glutamyltransferase family protein [Pseudomonadota bacterium]
MKNRLMRWLAVVSTTIFVGMVMAQELGPGARPVGADWSRSPVMSINGMAATAQPLASNIAIDVLQAGGSAVDAAVAANAALGLMEPTANGIGGDLFAIVWDPKTKQLYGYNASGRAPMSRSLDELREAIAAMKAQGKIPENYVGIPSHGSLSVTVPGAVDGWFALHERWGRLPMSDVLAAPIDYARNGFPLSPVIAAGFEGNRKEFQSVAAMIEEQDNATKTYFPGNVAPKAGDIFKNLDLARTFSALANEGRSAFYEGSIAQAMADYFEAIGAELTLDDLKAHTGEWVEPRGVEYHGYTLYELPPNGQGFAALMMLNILKQVELNEFDRGSVDIFHYMVEAKRLAYESMAGTFADPDFAEIPIEKLLSENHAKRQFARIRPDTVIEPNYLAIPLEGEGDTTYLTVVDGDGMMVSLIQSNYRGMGSGLVPTGLGFMLQDRGELFSLEDGHPNIYAPGKRPFHTIIPAFLMKGDQPFMSYGLMGGGMQPQGHVQILVNIADFGMNLQEAGDAARFFHVGGSSPDEGVATDYGTLFVEPGVPAETVVALRALGHKVKVDDTAGKFGGYQAISRDSKTGVLTGATEMRKDGTVVGY